MSNNSKKCTEEAVFIWQEREIRFDISMSQLALHDGEKIVDQMNHVEDTKGNNGDKGSLIITNLRLIWFCDNDKHINLSIGYDCVISNEIKSVISILKGGQSQALHLKTKYQNSRYEFVFTCVQNENQSRLFYTFQHVSKSYNCTKLYRDLKLRAAIIQDKQLILLNGEQIFSKYQGVWNLSADQGNLGQFIFTNVRVVWFAQLTESFNVSLPWIQIKCIRVRESKYGIALVLETSEFSGAYVLGFRVENIDQVFNEVASLFNTFKSKPVLGVQIYFDDTEVDISKVTIPREEDSMQIIDSGQEHIRSIQNTYAVQKKLKRKKDDEIDDQQIDFNEELGLACEKLPSGVSMEMLWKIV